MSEVIFEGASTLVREATHVTCVAKAPTGRQVKRIVWSSLGIVAIFGAMMVSRSNSAVIGAGMRAASGLVILLVGTLFVLFGIESWQRSRVSRTVFELAARSLHDGDGAKLTNLDQVVVVARAHEPRITGKMLGGGFIFLRWVSSVFELPYAGVDGTDSACEVAATWPTGERILSEPCDYSSGQTLAGKLTELMKPV